MLGDGEVVGGSQVKVIAVWPQDRPKAILRSLRYCAGLEGGVLGELPSESSVDGVDSPWVQLPDEDLELPLRSALSPGLLPLLAQLALSLACRSYNSMISSMSEPLCGARSSLSCERCACTSSDEPIALRLALALAVPQDSGATSRLSSAQAVQSGESV